MMNAMNEKMNNEELTMVAGGIRPRSKLAGPIICSDGNMEYPYRKSEYPYITNNPYSDSKARA